MEEKQEGKRSKKWLWIPIGVLAAFLIACLFLVISGRPGKGYSFLANSQRISHQEVILPFPGKSDIYQSVTGFKVPATGDEMMERIHPELSREGWTYTESVGVAARWTLGTNVIYLDSDPKGKESKVWIMNIEEAGPIHRFRVWMFNTFDKDSPRLQPK